MRDILTRVNPVQVKGRSKLYLLRDVIPHAAKYMGAPDVIDLNAGRARKVKAEAELAGIELAKEREDLIEWADQTRHLSPEASAEPGRWYSARAEYMRGVMDAVSDPTVRQVVVVSAAQVGKTEVLLNMIDWRPNA